MLVVLINQTLNIIHSLTMKSRDRVHVISL